MIEGTTPAGAETQEEASRWVRGMFARVAPRYDLLNRVLSFNIDRLWRRRTVSRVAAILARPNARVLDLCCGTGDLLFALERERAGAVLGSDFCHPMLVEAARKGERRGRNARLFEADALALPLAAGSLDLVTVAFGFRNFANYRAGLAELHRVIRPGGMLAVLEFSQPPNPLLRAGYNLYSKRMLPVIGGLLSGAPDAYSYLPESVRKFPGAEELAQEMRNAGFSEVRYERLTGGVVALHLAEVREPATSDFSHSTMACL